MRTAAGFDHVCATGFNPGPGFPRHRQGRWWVIERSKATTRLGKRVAWWVPAVSALTY
ncbi:MAG: hypothetical protein CM15mP103_09420 [Gammaproteobacteria bacterium]|nr:MAG: hypothetical protein CM15mP103_09420 [Gammaproteobacteria bacterium]